MSVACVDPTDLLCLFYKALISVPKLSPKTMFKLFFRVLSYDCVASYFNTYFLLDAFCKNEIQE